MAKKPITKSAVVMLVMALAALCSCSDSDQKALARRLSQADRVVVRDLADSSFVMRLDTNDVKKLVAALSSARKESESVTAVAQLRIEFFKGTNFICVLVVCPTVSADNIVVFGVDGERGTYSERSGTLELFANKALQEQGARKGTNRVIQ